VLPARLNVEQGRLIAQPTGADGSHLISMVSAGAFAVVPSAPASVEAGAVVEVLPFNRSRLGGL